MGKKKILILAICAAVVIAGSVAAVAILRGGFNTAGDETTTSSTAPQTEYDYNNYNPGVYEPVESSTDDASENNLLTTLQQIANTTKRAASKNPTKANKTPTKANSNKNNTTTTKKTGTVSYPGDDKLVDQVIGPNGQQFLGYRYDAEGDFYYTDDKDCWQSNAGFNEIYDNMTPVTAMYIDVLRVRFTYGDKDWMIQLWKGQYGWVLYGCEIGIYNKEKNRPVEHYTCANDDDMIQMEMVLWEKVEGNWVRTFGRPYERQWWHTGFVWGNMIGRNKDLQMRARITMRDFEMLDAVVKAFKDKGFKEVSLKITDFLKNPAVPTPDSFFVNGLDIYFYWTELFD